MIAGQGGELEHWVDTAERALAAVSTEEPIGSGSDQVGWAGSPLADMPGTIAILRADLARLRGDADSAIRLTRQLVSRLPPRSACCGSMPNGTWPGRTGSTVT